MTSTMLAQFSSLMKEKWSTIVLQLRPHTCSLNKDWIWICKNRKYKSLNICLNSRVSCTVGCFFDFSSSRCTPSLILPERQPLNCCFNSSLGWSVSLSWDAFEGNTATESIKEIMYRRRNCDFRCTRSKMIYYSLLKGGIPCSVCWGQPTAPVEQDISRLRYHAMWGNLLHNFIVELEP